MSAETKHLRALFDLSAGVYCTLTGDARAELGALVARVEKAEARVAEIEPALTNLLDVVHQGHLLPLAGSEGYVQSAVDAGEEALAAAVATPKEGSPT